MKKNHLASSAPILYQSNIQDGDIAVFIHYLAFRSKITPKLQARRRHIAAHPDGHQYGGRKPTETSVTEFCYIKRVNLSLEKLKNIEIIHRPEFNCLLRHVLAVSNCSVRGIIMV